MNQKRVKKLYQLLNLNQLYYKNNYQNLQEPH